MEKKLVVTAKYGSLEFEEVAHPYNPNAHQEQLDSCVSSIHQKMKEAGRYEMKNSFEYSEKIEERGCVKTVTSPSHIFPLDSI